MEKVFVSLSAVVVAGGIIVAGCGAGAKKATSAWVAESYSQTTFEDGVDEREAETLAVAYFLSYISGCGAVGAVIDRGDQWEAETVVGIAAAPYESIFICKATGVITCKKGPTVRPPGAKKGGAG